MVTVVVALGAMSTATSTEWLNVPLVPVTLSTKAPVAALDPALTARVEVALPPAGGVTGLGKSKLVSLGAVPSQDAARPT